MKWGARVLHVARRQVQKVRAWPVPPVLGHELSDLSIPLSAAPRHLPARNAEERQHLLEQVLRHHALRVGLCVFQKIFEVLVVDRFLELLLEGSEKKNTQVSSPSGALGFAAAPAPLAFVSVRFHLSLCLDCRVRRLLRVVLGVVLRRLAF